MIITKAHVNFLRSNYSRRLLSTSGGDDVTKKSFLRRLWTSYTEQLKNNPLTTKGTTAAMIFLVSDVGTQYISHKAQFHENINSDPRKKSSSQNGGTFVVDFQRAFSGAAFGIFGTSWIHYWWGFLEKAVEIRLPVARYKLQNTLVKVALDQALAAPVYIYSYYFITSWAKNIRAKFNIASRTREAHDKAITQMPPTMLKHWRLWPAVHTVNFYFVPLQHRVLVQNVVLVGWSGYLSYLSNNVNVEEKPTLKRRISVIGLDVLEDTLPEPEPSAKIRNSYVTRRRATETTAAAVTAK